MNIKRLFDCWRHVALSAISAGNDTNSLTNWNLLVGMPAPLVLFIVFTAFAIKKWQCIKRKPPKNINKNSSTYALRHCFILIQTVMLDPLIRYARCNNNTFDIRRQFFWWPIIPFVGFRIHLLPNDEHAARGMFFGNLIGK